jgi:hypothetical protein
MELSSAAESGGEEAPDLFPETSLTMMEAFGAGDDRIAEQAINQFADFYYEPLVQFTRSRGVMSEEARDVVQDFFKDVILQRKALHELNPERWRLRRFLRVALSRYIISYQRKLARQKRGGHLRQTLFDERQALLQDGESESATDPAILDFERVWARALLDRVYYQLRSRFRTSNREAFYDALEPCLSGAFEEGSLVKLAQRFQMKPNSVTVQLKRLREAYRHLLIREIQRTVTRPDDVRDEMAHLVKVLQSTEAPGRR